jgi:tetratricopeptide (TPR) repeat protein
MHRRVLPVVCLIIVTLQGCKSIAPHTQEPLSLTKQEKQFADSLAHFSQGLLYVNEDGSFSKNALTEYQAALTLEPKRSADYIIPRLLRYSLSSAPDMPSLEKIDKYCADYYTDKVRKEPDNPLYYVTLARLYFQQKKDDSAVATLKRGLRLAPQDNIIKMYCRLQGQEFYQNNEYTRTVACFELLSNKGSEQYERFHYILGELNEVLMQEDEAIKNYTLAAESESPLPEAFIQLSLIQYKTDPKEALKTMQKATRILPDNPKILFFLGYIHGLNKDYDLAISVYDKIPGIVEKDATVMTSDFYLSYGGAYEQAGNTEKATSIFQEGIRKHPKCHQLLNYLAYMWGEESFNLDKAQRYIMRALSIDSKNAAYIDTLGWIYFKQKKYEQARETISEAQELMPDDPIIMEHLGDVYDKLNENNKAVLWWKESYIADPENDTVKKKLESNNINLRHLRKEAEKRKKTRKQIEQP